MLANSHHFPARRAADVDPMSEDHERLLDRVASQVDALGTRITAEMRHGFDRVHERIDKVQDRQVADGERIAKLDERSKPGRSASNQTVAMRAIEAVERQPVLSITVVLLAAIAAVTWILAQ